MKPSELPDLLLLRARKVGSELAWSADEVVGVVRALASLRLAVLGLELWEFDDEAEPRVTGWTTYEVDVTAPWRDVVRASAQRAENDLAGHAADPNLWIHVQWISEQDARSESR
jgi:hypothetical protein